MVNNVIRLYRGNFPVPFIRSLVIMQPVRNQFELLKFQLTATLCGGGGRKGGGRGGERGGKSENGSRCLTGLCWAWSESAELDFLLPPLNHRQGWLVVVIISRLYTLHSRHTPILFNKKLFSFSLSHWTSVFEPEQRNNIYYLQLVCTWLIKTHTSLVFCCIWWKILLKGKFCCKISMTRYVTL